MKPTFREAETADIELLLGFVRQLYLLLGIPYIEQRAGTALAGLIRDPSLGRVWVIAQQGEPVGYMVLTFGYSLEYGGRDSFVDELFVDAAHRGQGIGTEALQFAYSTCSQLGIRALHLEVDRGYTQAQRLYRRLGFVQHDSFLMTRLLSA